MPGNSSFGNVGIVPSLAEFRGLSAAGLPLVVFLQGTTTPLDGGQGFYCVNLVDKSTPDNGSTVIVDTSGYRWELVSMDTAANIIAALSLNGTRPALDPLLNAIVTIAAAPTTDLSTVTQAAVTVTGSGETIASFGTLSAGPLRILTFEDVNTLDYDATSMILPGGANITTAAGDVAGFISLGSGNWQCLWYTEASGGTPGTLPISEGGTGATTAIQAAINLSPKGANIASAATIDLATATGPVVDITGSTGPVTSLGTVAAGARFLLRFTGTPTLTNNGTSLILPTGADIVVAAGDVALFASLGSGNWYCAGYQRASGQPLALPAPLAAAVTRGAFSVYREYLNAGSPHTWTKPAGLVALYVQVIGSGGGGGGGARVASGTAASGGAGGGGGAFCEGWLSPADLGATESISVGAGGAGGAGATSDDTAGSNGEAGSQSAFGPHLIAYAGGRGGGGQVAAHAGGGGGAGSVQAGNDASGATPGASAQSAGSGGAANNAGGAGNLSGGGGGGSNGAAGNRGGHSATGAPGGGAGGGLATTPVSLAGGDGGQTRGIYTPAVGGAAASAGAAGPSGHAGAGGAGGGGGSNASGIGGVGGTGACGAGGGGGGAGCTGDGGAGGAGGDGLVRVWEIY